MNPTPRKVLVTVTANLTEDILLEFLQHIRDFDSKHFDKLACGIMIDCPEMEPSEMVKDWFEWISRESRGEIS